jgi:hypothetical protein
VTGRFSGFEEELTGLPSAKARPHHRVITSTGRKGGTMAGISYGWTRIQTEQIIPSIIDTEAGLQNVLEESRLSAMVNMMTEGKIRHSPPNTFIMKGGKYKPGPYRFEVLPKKKERQW